MSSLEARVIRGCRVQERVEEDDRTLLSVELAFADTSWLTLGCAADGVALQIDPHPMYWSGIPEHGHIEIHSHHPLCDVLRPGGTITQERALTGADDIVIGLALATCEDGHVFVFNSCGELHFARELPPDIAAMTGEQPPA